MSNKQYRVVVSWFPQPKEVVKAENCSAPGFKFAFTGERVRTWLSVMNELTLRS